MRALLLASVISVTIVAGSAVVGLRVYHAPGPLEAARDIVVPHGGLDEVGAALVSAGAVRSRFMFKVAALASLAQGNLHAAELHFPDHASLAQVLEVLRDGRPVEHRVTIAEGLSAAQIAQIVARQGDLLTGALAVPAEGSLLPETYVFERGSTVSAVLGRMRGAMRRTVDTEWAARAPGLGLRSAREAVVLASIVEHEAKLSQERPMIARVFLNRLASGMKLQADPTVSYGAEGGLGVLVRPIDRDDLARVDEYNTYVIAGLPAGPICSPGLASLKAVLHPATGDALYFVADGTGGHAFSATLKQHEANVARYRAQQNASRAALKR
jgi:UPF0755 protein